MKKIIWCTLPEFNEETARFKQNADNIRCHKNTRAEIYALEGKHAVKYRAFWDEKKELATFYDIYHTNAELDKYVLLACLNKDNTWDETKLLAAIHKQSKKWNYYGSAYLGFQVAAMIMLPLMFLLASTIPSSLSLVFFVVMPLLAGFSTGVIAAGIHYVLQGLNHYHSMKAALILGGLVLGAIAGLMISMLIPMASILLGALIGGSISLIPTLSLSFYDYYQKIGAFNQEKEIQFYENLNPINL